MFNGLFNSTWYTASPTEIILRGVFANMIQKVFLKNQFHYQQMEKVGNNEAIIPPVLVVLIFMVGVFPKRHFDEPMMQWQ